MKTSELTGPALNWAVAKSQFTSGTARSLINAEVRPYSTDWSQGGPIIEREGIELVPDGFGAWNAAIRGGDCDDFAHGPTPLIAAMRCYVASKLGDEVDVPLECLIYDTDEE